MAYITNITGDTHELFQGECYRCIRLLFHPCLYELDCTNWIGLEAAAGYKTSIGVVGLHSVHVQQYQEDDNNPLGPSRLRSTNAGAFFTTLIPEIDAAVTVQYR